MDLQVKVSDKAYDLGEHVVALVGAVKSAISDGFQISDLIPLGQAALADISPISGDVSGAVAEAKSDLRSFLNGVSQSLLDLGFVFAPAAKQEGEHKKVGSWLSFVSFLASAAPQLIALVQQLLASLKSMSAEQKKSIGDELFKAASSGDLAKCEQLLRGHVEGIKEAKPEQLKAPEKVEEKAEEKKA